MKIDLHTHTRQCKTGDAPTREITPADFCDIVTSTEVGVIAVTNHNWFDLDQFNEIVVNMENRVQVWPGIELDVVEDSVRGHLLVIVSPERHDQFASAVHDLTHEVRPDDFTISIEKVLEVFDSIEPIYVAHYRQKKPNISDESIELLIKKAAYPARVIREVTNSISAGIYISHGQASIYGSDVQDWASYVEKSVTLPDLRLPVESFEHFCLLLEKDPTTINTALDQKIAETLSLVPFEDDTCVTFRAFNDINVVFGPKGTGKTRILEAIARHYTETGVNVGVYESASDRLDDIFDIKGRDISLDLKPLSIDYCKAQIEKLRTASEVDVTNLSNYLNFFNSQTTNKKAKLIKLKDIDPQEEGTSRRAFENINSGENIAEKFLEYLNEHSSARIVLTDKELEETKDVVSRLIAKLRVGKWDNFTAWKEVNLLNSAIEKFRAEVARKTGAPPKPTTTGFRQYAVNRLQIASNAIDIIGSIETEIPIQSEIVGSLGDKKGELELRTEFVFQNGALSDSELGKMRSINKSIIKKFVRKIREVLGNAYGDCLFQCISELNEIEDVEKIETVYELLLFKRYFAINGQKYVPSSGESSMVMLHKELQSNKDIYILDEPERSLGNEYINEVIVPLIRERALAGKKIFISTHDANIAVRTLPYSTIYRCHEAHGYATYVGNPFSNNLTNIENESDVLDWKVVCLKTLEGGESAFGERGKIYGNR